MIWLALLTTYSARSLYFIYLFIVCVSVCFCCCWAVGPVLPHIECLTTLRCRCNLAPCVRTNVCRAYPYSVVHIVREPKHIAQYVRVLYIVFSVASIANFSESIASGKYSLSHTVVDRGVDDFSFAQFAVTHKQFNMFALRLVDAIAYAHHNAQRRTSHMICDIWYLECVQCCVTDGVVIHNTHAQNSIKM